MALALLATTADLQVRGVDVGNGGLCESMLAAASAAVREAAGSPISETTSTVSLVAFSASPWLTLPGQPVTAVSAATIDGEAVTDFRLLAGRLYRTAGWGGGCEPAEVILTMTHGFIEVPADIVDLVCDFATAGILTAGEGSRSGVASESGSIDDYSTTVRFAEGADAQASVMEVPERTARMLRARFGAGAYVTGEGA